MSELINANNLVITSEQFRMLLPYFIVLVGGCVSLLAGSMHANQSKRNQLGFAASLLTIIAAIFSTVCLLKDPSATLFNGMMKVDLYGNLFNLTFLVSTGVVLLGSYSYLEKEKIHHAEYYSLAVFSCMGMMLLAASLDLVVLFISLEIMSIAMYVLVGFRRTDIRSNEAALKYFILGAAVSAVLLYGIALIYGATGTMNMVELASWIKSNPANNPLFILGCLLLVVGFLFKVAVVPFHMWMPDVYEGAPTSVTNLMTTGLKAAAFAAFLRVFISLSGVADANFFMNTTFHHVLWVMAVLTMFFGNVIAIAQKNIKRMLAYSSIAHSGYLLVGFIAGKGSDAGYSAIVVYLVSYAITNLGAFSIIAMISKKGDEGIQVEDFSGIGFKRPVLGFAMAVFMFSMAGVPPTAGFIGKYLIFGSAVQAGEIWLTVLGVLCSAISAFYYLRVIVYMYMKDSAHELHKTTFAIPAVIAVAIATVGALQFGLFPSVLIDLAKRAAMNI